MLRALRFEPNKTTGSAEYITFNSIPFGRRPPASAHHVILFHYNIVRG